jgi:hypothetical protein
VYFYLTAVHRHADRAGLAFAGAVAGDGGGAFGDAVTVENVDAEVVHTLLVFRVEVCAAADDHIEVAAEVVKYLLEYLAPLVDAYFHKKVAYPETLFEDILSAHLACGLPNAVVYRLNNKGDGGEIVGLVFLEVALDILDAVAHIAPLGDDIG